MAVVAGRGGWLRNKEATRDNGAGIRSVRCDEQGYCGQLRVVWVMGSKRSKEELKESQQEMVGDVHWLLTAVL